MYMKGYISRKKHNMSYRAYLLHVGEVIADREEVLVGPLAPVGEGVHQRALVRHVLHITHITRTPRHTTRTGRESRAEVRQRIKNRHQQIDVKVSVVWHTRYIATQVYPRNAQPCDGCTWRFQRHRRKENQNKKGRVDNITDLFKART